MKKLISVFKLFSFILLFIIAITFLYLFISNINRNPKVGTWVIHKANNDSVNMNIKKETITNQSLSVTLSNHTNEEYIYGTAYTIEYYRNGLWHYLKPTYNMSFLLNSITLEANSNKELNFFWGDYYGKLSKGKYRIIKKFKSKELNNEFYVSAEFIIE